jgi:hypothetical protein
VPHPSDHQEIVVSAPFHHVDRPILIADNDVLLIVMIIIKTIIEVADIEMTTMIATERIVMIEATTEVMIEVMNATIGTMTAIVALRLVMALLQEVDQEDQCIGNLS